MSSDFIASYEFQKEKDLVNFQSTDTRNNKYKYKYIVDFSFYFAFVIKCVQYKSIY